MGFLKGELAKRIYKGAVAGVALLGIGSAGVAIYEASEARRTDPHQDFSLSTADRIASDKAQEAKREATTPAPYIF